jgi:hypothetical protein
VTAADTAISDQVVIKCPACGACESADPIVLADAPTIVCRECGETWPSVPKRTRRRTNLIAASAEEEAEAEVIEARRRPLVTFSDGAEKAWAAKMEGDYWPEPPRRSRMPATAAAMASVFFFAAFLGGREAAVAALPDLAGLYAAIGLPVNLGGLAIEDVTAERTKQAAGTRLTVSGTIRNVSGGELDVPPISAILYDSAMMPMATHGFETESATLAPGGETQFLMEFAAVPEQAEEVAVRFRQPGESAPDAAGETAAE